MRAILPRPSLHRFQARWADDFLNALGDMTVSRIVCHAIPSK